AQDAGPAGGRAVVRGRGAGREDPQGATEAQAARGHQGDAPRLEEGDRAAPRGQLDRDLRRGPRLMSALASLASSTCLTPANRRIAASSVAPVASGYERSLRPCAARFSAPCTHGLLGGER